MRGEKILKFFVEVGAVKTIRKFRTVVLGDVTKNIFKFLISNCDSATPPKCGDL